MAQSEGQGRGHYPRTEQGRRNLAAARMGDNRGALAKWAKPGEHERMSAVAKAQMTGDRRLIEAYLAKTPAERAAIQAKSKETRRRSFEAKKLAREVAA